MIEYHLHEDVIVPADKAPAFERLVAEFLRAGSFRRLDPTYDNRLVMAFRTAQPFEYTGYQRFQTARGIKSDDRNSSAQHCYRYINIHAIPDLQELDIARIMILCADDSLYTEINGLVIREMQNFVTRVQHHTFAFDPERKGPFCRVIRQFSTKNLGGYIFGSGALLPSLSEGVGWNSLGVYQNVTGPLNTVTELWDTTDARASKQAEDVPWKTANPPLYKTLLAPYPAQATVVEHFIAATYFQP